MQANTAPQGDNKEIKNKLAEKIAEERAKALLKSMESKKRPAEESPQQKSGESHDSQKSKKPRKSKGKGKNKSK